MKVCSYCHIKKYNSCFRKRLDKRRGNCRYLNNQCMQCDKERRKVYYDSKKNDPEFKKQNCERANKYRITNLDKIKVRRSTKEYAKKHAMWANKRYHRMKDLVSVKMKTKRQTIEYKEMMRAYRKRNKDKIFMQEVVTKRRYHEKHRDNLTDEYISHRLFNKIDRDFIEEYPELIEAKRVQILITRKIKNHGN